MPEGRGSYFGLWAAVFSAPFAAAGLSEFSQQFFEVGLGPIGSDLLEYYQTMIKPIFVFLPNWVASLFGWSLPDWYTGLLPLFLMTASAARHGGILARGHLDRELVGAGIRRARPTGALHLGALPVFALRAFAFFVVAFIGLGLWSVIVALSSLFKPPGDYDNPFSAYRARRQRLTLALVGLTFLALLIAFAENWYA